MIPEISFDPKKGDLHVNFIMFGVVFIAYTFKYWSSNVNQPKVLIEEPGNNQQDHDDHFDLEYKNDKPKDQDRRIVHFSGTSYSAEKDDTGYQIIIEVYQNLTQQEKNGKLPVTKRIGQVSSGLLSIKNSDGYQYPTVMTKLVSL
jgi:hypothetical protein